MNISYKWLKDYVDLPDSLSPEEIALFENYLDKYFGLKMYDTAVGNRANPPPNRCAHFYVCAKK